MLKVGKEFGADYVVSGYVYTVNIPFKYSPTTTDPVPIFTQNNDDLTAQIFTSLFVYGQKSEREAAIVAAGTYVNVTLFIIHTKTGEKEFLLKNKRVLKIG